MNGKSQMQEGKNWIFSKEINANRFFRGSHWLEIWENHLWDRMEGAWLWTLMGENKAKRNQGVEITFKGAQA